MFTQQRENNTDRMGRCPEVAKMREKRWTMVLEGS
jgi:hypothetical protein